MSIVLARDFSSTTRCATYHNVEIFTDIEYGMTKAGASYEMACFESALEMFESGSLAVQFETGPVLVWSGSKWLIYRK